MSDASREAFEKWARRTGFDLSLSFDLELVPEGYYGSATTRSAWNAWQAALQSGEPAEWVIEVENGQVVMSRIGANFTGYLYTASQPVVPEWVSATEWNKKIRDSTDKLLAEAGFEPDCTIRHGLAMMNFYSTPQPVVDVNQKLVEALQAVLDCGSTSDQWWIDKAREALLSAGKENNNE
jgi:hypothetical protein